MGKLPNKTNQLPDFFITQSFLVNGHPGSLGSIFDDPEHLTVRYLIHQFSTGKIPWRGSQRTRKTSIAVSLKPMTKPARGWFGVLIIKPFAFRNIFWRIRQGIFFLQISCGSAPGFSVLRTNPGCDADHFPIGVESGCLFEGGFRVRPKRLGDRKKCKNNADNKPISAHRPIRNQGVIWPAVADEGPTTKPVFLTIQ
jgi:hypothetical protein